MNVTVAQLLAFAAAGDAAGVQRALSGDGASAKASAADPSDGETPLMKAAVAGHLDVVNVLLAAGAKIDKHSRSQWTALSMAVRSGQVAIVRRFLQARPSLKWKSALGDTLLSVAVEYQQSEILDMLLAAKADVTECERNDRLKSPLVLACKANTHDVLVKLLRAGVSPNHIDRDGDTALAAAAEIGDGRLVATLLSAGADVDIHHPMGGPLGAAIQNGHVAIVKQLLAANASVSDLYRSAYPPLVHAAYCGYVEIVRLLLLAGADENQVDYKGETAILHAARKRNTTMVDLLLTADDVAVDHTMTNGDTALMCAIGQDCIGIVENLLAAGANVHHVNNTRETTLMRAAERGIVDIVERLLALGVAVARRDSQGRTALHHASEWGRLDAVNLLLSTGMLEVDGTDGFGETALTQAVVRGHVDVVNTLLAWGANINHVRPDGANHFRIGSSGATPLITSSAWRNTTMLKVLLAAGASVDLRAPDTGKSAFLNAAYLGNGEALDVLFAHGADVNQVNN